MSGFNPADFDTSADNETAAPKKEAFKSMFMRPGFHQVKITDVVLPVGEDGNWQPVNDTNPTWFRFRLDTVNAAGETAKLSLEVPTGTREYVISNGKSISFRYQEFCSFLEALGYPGEVTNPAVVKSFLLKLKDNPKLFIGMLISVTLGYRKGTAHAEYKNSNLVLSDSDGQPILIDGKVVSVPSSRRDELRSLAKGAGYWFEKFPTPQKWSKVEGVLNFKAPVTNKAAAQFATKPAQKANFAN